MITITPINPNSNDVIIITATWTNPGSCDTDASTLTDNTPVFTIQMESEFFPCTIGIPPLLGRTFQVGPLQAGQYTVNGNASEATFVVAQAHPSTVPSTSFLGLIILSSMLIIAGKRYIK